MPQRFDTLAQWCVGIHRGAHARAGTIGTNQHAEGHAACGSGRISDVHTLAVKVDVVRRLAEVNLRTCGLGGIQQQGIQGAA